MKIIQVWSSKAVDIVKLTVYDINLIGLTSERKLLSFLWNGSRGEDMDSLQYDIKTYY